MKLLTPHRTRNGYLHSWPVHRNCEDLTGAVAMRLPRRESHAIASYLKGRGYDVSEGWTAEPVVVGAEYRLWHVFVDARPLEWRAAQEIAADLVKQFAGLEQQGG